MLSYRRYDSSPETRNHINRVQDGLEKVIKELAHRMRYHDSSKLHEPEKSMYDEFTPKLADLTYGSPEYKETLEAMGPALAHHYENNSHHPEHYPEPNTPEIDRLIDHISALDPDDPSLPWLDKYLEELESRVNGMSLLDVIEMLADWKAASERHNDGDLQKSLEINRKRFGLSDQLFEILRNTVRELEW